MRSPVSCRRRSSHSRRIFDSPGVYLHRSLPRLCMRSISGDRQRAERIVAGLRTRALTSYISPVDVALVQLGLGDRDSSLGMSEEAYRTRAVRMVTPIGDPFLAELRPEARHHELLTAMRLPVPRDRQSFVSPPTSNTGTGRSGLTRERRQVILLPWHLPGRRRRPSHSITKRTNCSRAQRGSAGCRVPSSSDSSLRSCSNSTAVIPSREAPASFAR